MRQASHAVGVTPNDSTTPATSATTSLAAGNPDLFAAAQKLIHEHRLPADFHDVIESVYRPLAKRIQMWQHEQQRPLILGVNGAQGTGKSTLAAFMKLLLNGEHGLSSAVLSIDDIYLTRAERRQLAADVHPLLQTRGVRAGHDVSLGLTVLRQLTGHLAADAADKVAVPRFDKSVDDRAERSTWPIATAPVDVVLFEGWCVGATAQDSDDLAGALNALEDTEDSNGVWRNYVNAQLSKEYIDLFAPIDRMVMLRAPSLEKVIDWRTEQERKLAAQVDDNGQKNRVMSDEEIVRFVAHYERVTRHLWATLPDRADVIVDLNDDHSIAGVSYAEGRSK